MLMVPNFVTRFILKLAWNSHFSFLVWNPLFLEVDLTVQPQMFCPKSVATLFLELSCIHTSKVIL